MTRTEFLAAFLAACEDATIAPELAVENEDIQQAIRDKDIKAVRRILVEEF